MNKNWFTDNYDLTPRDKDVICSIGKHKALSQRQIQELYFPSYQTCQRRIRKRLRGDNYISLPFYYWITEKNRQTIYRLENKGRKIYEKITGEKYKKPTFSENYIPHLYYTNQILLELYDYIEDFQLEYKDYQRAKVQMDVYAKLNNGLDVAFEMDISEGEGRKQIQKQFRNYEKLHQKYDIPSILIWFSNRKETIYKWCDEVAETNFKFICVGRDQRGLSKIKQKLNTITSNRCVNKSLF